MSVRQSLGKVAVVPKGSWDGTKTYEFLDIVKYGGGSYIARKDVPIGTAITSTEYWVSLVDKGEIGDDGVSPSVTVTPITGGHRVTITDAAHPQGQSIDVMDGEVNNIDTTLTISGAAADAKATGEAIAGLAFNGEVPINGNVHNYYFGGGANYKTLTPSNNTRTAVFPLEDGKRYHVIINGNVSSIGFANVEYESTGDLSDNTAGNPTDLYIVNSQNYKYLYVFYYNSAGATVENPNVKVLAETNLVTNERLNSALAPINDWYTPVIAYDGITDGKYLTDTGYIGDSTLSCVTDFVPVIAGRKYKIEGVYLASSRAVVYYDDSKALIGASDKGSAETTIEITVPQNAAYLRTNGASGVAPVIKAVDHPINAEIDALDERATEIEDSIYVDNTIDIGALTSGYVTSYALTVFASQTIYHTGMIEVVGGATINVNNYCSVGGNGVVVIVFDENQNGIDIITDGVGGGTVGSKTVYLPLAAKYIVINAKPNSATPSIVYVDRQFTWSAPINILNRLESVASKNFMQLFKTATAKPICCIIDDDTLNATDMENFATVLENNGVRGTVACLTKFFETQTDLEAKLHDLERRGHQVVLHGYTQADAYRDAVAFDDANYKLAESDFVKGATDLKKSGFVNCDFWVTPFGVSQSCMQKLARKWGMKCLVTTAKTEFNGTDGKYSRWEIQRSGLNPSDTGTLTYAQLLALADQCAAANGWLLVNTHIYNWTGGYDRINDFITHCKGKGFEFMTLGEAWEIRKPIYDWYSTF